MKRILHIWEIIFVTGIICCFFTVGFFAEKSYAWFVVSGEATQTIFVEFVDYIPAANIIPEDYVTVDEEPETEEQLELEIEPEEKTELEEESKAEEELGPIEEPETEEEVNLEEDSNSITDNDLENVYD